MDSLPNNHRDNDPWHQVADGLTKTLLLRDDEIKKLGERLLQVEGQMDAVSAAASFDPATDRDLETCVRRLYHEHADAVRLLAAAQSKLSEAKEGGP